MSSVPDKRNHATVQNNGFDFFNDEERFP